MSKLRVYLRFSVLLPCVFAIVWLFVLFCFVFMGKSAVPPIPGSVLLSSLRCGFFSLPSFVDAPRKICFNLTP